MTAAGFLVAQCAFIVFGWPIAFVSPVRSFSLAGRLAAAFVTGALAYTIFATLLSLFALEWSVAVLAIPLTLLSAFTTLLLARANAAPPRVRERWGLIDSVALAVIGVALLHVFAAFATTRASSADYIFFWGVKALLFAQHGGIDAELLASPRMLHLHTNYPPLVPLTTGWSVLVTGKMSWRFGLVTSALWFAATIPLVIELLKMRLGASQARVAGAIWSVALGSSLVYSMSAGNGEAPLLAYETLAVGAFVVRERFARLVLMSIGLAGTLLTKNEGMIAFVIILVAYVLGLLLDRARVTVRELLLLVAISLAAFSTWLLFEDVYGVPMSDATRETLSGFTLRYTPTIVRESIRNLNTGTWGVAWLVALAALVSRRGTFRLWGPPVAAGFATIAVFVGYYFLHWTDPAQWIQWTLPRLAQPALSMMLLGGALAFFAPPGEQVPASED